MEKENDDDDNNNNGKGRVHESEIRCKDIKKNKKKKGMTHSIRNDYSCT
jgi:hypothetical protein